MVEPSEITTHPPRAQITRELVQPPARVYLTLNDRLYIRSRNSLASVALRIAGRLLTADGEIVPFQFTHTPATDRSASFESFQLAEGYLLSAVVFPSTGAPIRGQTFVEIGFVRGIGAAVDVVDVLAKDYVAEAEPLAFPGSPIRSSLEGPGALRRITGTNRAAGQEVLETVPTDARWRFMSMFVSLVTDATAISRLVRVHFTDIATIFYVAQANSSQTASQTVTYLTSSQPLRSETASASFRVISIPELLLSAAFTIVTLTSNFQAADNYAAPQLLVEEWIED